MKAFNILKNVILSTILTTIFIKAHLNQEPRVLYNPKYIKFNLNFSVFNYCRDSSYLYVKIFPKDLLYSYLNNEGKYKAILKINYILTELNENNKSSNLIIDSATIIYEFYREGVPQEILKKIRIYTPNNKIYALKINTTDVVRKYTLLRYIIIDRKDFSSQDILLYKDTDTIPLFSPYDLKTDSFKIKLNNSLGIKNLYLFKIENHKNPPPIFIRDEKYFDTIDFTKKFISKIESYQTMKLPYPGYYLLQFDSIKLNGVIINYNNMNFPKTTDVNNLIQPLIYLTTTNEYLQLINSTNKKLAVDNFWLKLSKNNKEKAKEMIRIYYNRVSYANQFFTSYKPGWQTDRGMIYIIFGIPDMVILEHTTEKWIYLKRTFSNKIEFEFSLSLLPFCNNNYILERYPEYEQYWRNAISSWRNGKIFYF